MTIPFSLLEPILQDIHAATPRIVYEFAGAGVQALAWLHGVGGSSRTVLEATDRYASASLASLIGVAPQQATSPEVAQAMATQAYRRARELAEPDLPAIGLSCTATIATDRTKRGDHRCCISTCDAQGMVTYSLTLTKGQRTRYEEESLVSLIVLRALADMCGIAGLPDPPLFGTETITQIADPTPLLAQFMAGINHWVEVSPNGHLTTGDVRPNVTLLSGAFNPLHAGHRQLAEVASDLTGQPVYFELPLVNADKAPIDLQVARRRWMQFAGVTPLLFTRAPLFTMKADIFPNSTFILGVDTAKRLVQLRFYRHNPAEMDAAFAKIRDAGCRFLVAGRMIAGRFHTLTDANLPSRYQDLFQEIPPDRFRLDISSTELRKYSTYRGRSV